MNEDLISRQAAITSFRLDDDGKAWSMEDIIYRLEQLPSAQPERKKGKWMDGQCSICGCDIPAYIIDWKWQKDMNAKFCPNCGAKMEGEDGYR